MTAIRTNKQPLRRKTISFLRAGEKPSQHPRPGLLATASDWQLRVDLGKQLKSPDHINPTTIRPDMVIYSDSTKLVITWEQCPGKRTWWRLMKGSAPNTRSWWSSAGVVVGGCTASQWRWAVGSLQGVDSAGP